MSAFYGCVVVGPPGAGKSTMCAGLCRYMALARRPVALVNLDPACEGEGLAEFEIDVRDFCSVERAMEEQGLGANGALLYCMAELRQSTWLREKIGELEEGDAFPYVIFDLPGQTELFTHDGNLRAILDDLKQSFDARLVAAHCVDVAHCAVPSTFVAACLLSLTAMLKLELPHANVLTKIDLAGRYELCFDLEYFKEAQELHRIVPYCGVEPRAEHPVDEEGGADGPFADGPFADSARYNRQLQKLTGKIGELVDDFALVCFQPLDISDGLSVARLVRLLDKANGHPAGVHAPAALVEDASELFLAHKGRAGAARAFDPTSGEAAEAARARAFEDARKKDLPGDRTYRTHAPRGDHRRPSAADGEPKAFSWHT